MVKHFYVSTKEAISSLQVPDAKFQKAQSEYLWHLTVTPEKVVQKIKAMKDNKSPRMDGIPPKLLKETVKQVTVKLARNKLLARVFNLSKKKGSGSFRMERSNYYNYLKRVQEIIKRITYQ